MNDHLRFYKLKSDLPAGFFGQVNAATAVSFEGVAPGRARLEFFFLLTRGTPRLWRDVLEVPLREAENGDDAWDINRVHEEGHRLLEANLDGLQARRAKESGRPDLAEPLPPLERTENRPLLALAHSGEWTNELRELAAQAQAPGLKRYCEAALQEALRRAS
jgi:hypothetical protein